jgi:fatty acid desaturase
LFSFAEEKRKMVVYMPYILAAAVISLVALRFIGMRKTGAAAVKYEVIYLVLYAFFGGILFSFLLSNPDMGIMALLILITFITGFVMRLIPLIRLIKKVEDEMADRTNS